MVTTVPWPVKAHVLFPYFPVISKLVKTTLKAMDGGGWRWGPSRGLQLMEALEV